MTALTTARISRDVADAAAILSRALGIEPGTCADLLPEQAEWQHMSDAARMIELGQWLKSVCYEQAAKVATALPVKWEPIGGAKYAGHND